MTICKLTRLPTGQIKYGPITCTGKNHAKRYRSTEWDKCVTIGLKMGIPESGWRKAHSDKGWAWVSKKPPIKNYKELKKLI